ncbi:hypothetical protein [Aeromonas veronii]|uniref:hypothetical protein n=1 Tax=Aeromonas TaxID=642 RepID=UPI0011A58A13|nr:hypothetical protein [Aeromonas veronii]
MEEIKVWLQRNIYVMADFTDETYTSISDFSIMWAIFEGTQLQDRPEDRAAVDELEFVAQRTSYCATVLEYARTYWSHRYIGADGEGNDKFRRLGFRHKPHSELVLRVLKGEVVNEEEQIHALLLIVYRLRNNLFHGEKDMAKINSQVENLKYGASVLKDIIEATRRHVFLNVT